MNSSLVAVLVELLQSALRTLYHALGGEPIEHAGSSGTTRGFCFDPESPAVATIVLLHGLGDASTTWYQLVPALREHARVIALDLPPFGRAELTDGHALGPDEHADLVAPLIEEYATGPTTIVGHSMGGWVTQWLLHRYPDLVDRAVLVAPAGAPLEGSYDAVKLLTPHGPDEALAYIEALWYEPPLGVEAVVGDLLDRLHGPKIRGFLAMTDRGHSLDEPELSEIQTPVHVVWGQHDDLLDADTPAFLAQHWGAPVDRTYLARAGHMVHLERRDAFERIVRDVAGLED